MTPFILGIATGLTSMSMLCAYLWSGWRASARWLRIANSGWGSSVMILERLRDELDEADAHIAELRPLATMGAKKRAKDARYRALKKVRGK